MKGGGGGGQSCLSCLQLPVEVGVDHFLLGFGGWM